MVLLWRNNNPTCPFNASATEKWDKTPPPKRQAAKSGWEHRWQWKTVWQVRVYGVQLREESDGQSQYTHFAYLPVRGVTLSLLGWRLGNAEKEEEECLWFLLQILSHQTDTDGERCIHRQISSKQKFLKQHLFYPNLAEWEASIESLSVNYDFIIPLLDANSNSSQCGTRKIITKTATWFPFL